MSNTMTFKFDELPLIVDGLFKDSGVTGQAEISYHADGEWAVLSIGIEITRFKVGEERDPTGLTRNWIDRVYWLDEGDPIRGIIYHRLEHEWRKRVQREVDDQIAQDFADRANWQSDHARDLRKHEGVM